MSSSSPSSRAKVAAAALATALLACTMPTDSAAAKDPAPHVRKYVETVKVQGQGRLTWFGFHVYDAQQVEVSGLNLARSGFWTVHVCYSRDVKVADLIIRNNIGGRGPSTDGIDIDSSERVLVERSPEVLNVDPELLNIHR